MSKLRVPYFSLFKSEESKSADIIIFGDILSKRCAYDDELYPAGVNSFDLVAQLNGIPEDYEITVHINSYGGEVKEGMAIYNALRTRNVITVCEGFAASAASLIFMAGKRRVMNAASLLFIHQASTLAVGSPDDLEKAAADLRTITEAAASAYKEAGVTVSDDELAQMLKSETWIKAEDAVRMGFATEVAAAEDGGPNVYTNCALPSIAETLLRAQEGAADPIQAAADRIGYIADQIEKILHGDPQPAPGAQKGFFSFK